MLWPHLTDADLATLDERTALKGEPAAKRVKLSVNLRTSPAPSISGRTPWRILAG